MKPHQESAKGSIPPRAAATVSTGLVRYFDRSVDLGPFLAGFPFERWMPSLETGRLFFFATGDRYTLKMLDLPGVAGPLDLGKATTVSDVDWSKRSLWSLHHHAASVLLAHNHPSGCAEPSTADIALTRHLQQALGLLEIAVLDHLIVAQGRTTSMAQSGLMPLK